MPMMRHAPPMRAPCTALRPSGPQPTTATADPAASVANVRRGGRAQAGHADAAAHHAQIDGGGLGEDRHDPLFQGDHQLGEVEQY